MNDFKHKTPIQLRFKDGDVMGHVNNANHFTYFELARVHYFRDVVGNNVNWNRDGIIIAKMIIEYKKPLLLTDEVYAYTRCIKLGTKSFDLDYVLIAKKADEELTIATGFSTLVCFNYETNQTMMIPDTWRKKMQEFDVVP